MRNKLMVVLVALAGVAACKGKREQCIEWGVAYFKDIGSYPTLSNGSNAEEVAKTRCSRRTDAFPDPDRPAP